MPIVAPAITSAILTASPTLRGPVWLQMAGAIGRSVAIWSRIQTNVTLVGSVIGTVGGGLVTGKFFLVPVPLPVNAAVAATSLLGPSASLVATAVGVGVGTSLNASAGYRGTSTGAIGADISKVVFSDGPSLVAVLVSNFNAAGLRGPQAAQLALGLGNGIAAMVLTGGGTGVAAGAPGPSPGTGISKSALF
jgi:hypothetical protein